MKELKVETKLQSLFISELSDKERQLAEQAYMAAERAYAPYSQFHVGAAVLLENGEIISGNNQENAAYPSGLCAERVALFYAGAQYPNIPVSTLAIIALKDGEIREHISPCGSCRQVLLETEQRYQRPIRILLCGRDEVLALKGATSLLPLSFGQEDLMK